VQSESVELGWSDELTVCAVLPLHSAFHIACTWSNSKYEDVYIVQAYILGGGTEQVWGLPAPP